MSTNDPQDIPGVAELAVSGLQAWVGDYLAEVGNGLHHPMDFYVRNRPVSPEDLPAPPSGRLVVLVHGLGGNEGLWAYPAPESCGGYGELLERHHGYLALYVRYNSGLRISTNGAALHGLLERYLAHHHEAVRSIVCIGHSMGGLVLRSACHVGRESAWAKKLTRVFYLGSPHQGAPLEKFANLTTHLLGKLDVTAARVIRDLINTRSVGVKDLRYGNLVEEDWLDHDVDALLVDGRSPLPWLEHVRHHRIVGHAVAALPPLGDGMVQPDSASAQPRGDHPGAPRAEDIAVLAGVPHLTLTRHPRVYEHIERWIGDG